MMMKMFLSLSSTFDDGSDKYTSNGESPERRSNGASCVSCRIVRTMDESRGGKRSLRSGLSNDIQV